MAIHDRRRRLGIPTLVFAIEIVLAAVVQVITLVYTQPQTTPMVRQTILLLGVATTVTLIIIASSTMIATRRMTVGQAAFCLIGFIALLVLLD